MYKLLIRGESSFKEIINQIDLATESIEIKMFIWRDDVIGNLIIKHLYKAANRGVKINIDKDTYGVIFEKSEEGRQSLFHKRFCKYSLMAWFGFYFVYYKKESPKFIPQYKNLFYNEFVQHPNIKINSMIFKDHTKYYVFDNKTMIIGGINIEDKEYSKDLQGRFYQDYMLLVNNEDLILKFKKRITNKLDFEFNNDFDFILNTENKKEALPNILAIINNAKKRIYMAMAYFGNYDVYDALLNAKKRGVEIVIVTSHKSNIQPHYNNYKLRMFLKNGVKVYLHPGLVHAKTILVDDYLILGSINLNNSSLKKLKECSVYLNDKGVITDWLLDFKRLKKESFPAIEKELKYNLVKSYLEEKFS